MAGTKTAYPWGGDLADAVSYAHVRSTTWQKAARKYNAALDNPVEIAHPPVGAVKDFLSGKALDPPEYVEAGSVYEFREQACDVGFRIIISTK